MGACDPLPGPPPSGGAAPFYPGRNDAGRNRQAKHPGRRPARRAMPARR